MTHRCRYCGHPLEIPQYFGSSRQRMFEYIWRHPGCTNKEIMQGLYGKWVTTNVVAVHLSNIRKGLAETGFDLISVPIPPLHGAGTPCMYYIKPRTEGIHHGTV